MPDNYKVNGTHLNTIYKYLNRVGAIQYSDFVNSREVNLKVDLNNGCYLVVPCMDRDDVNLEFMIQIFSEEKIELK